MSAKAEQKERSHASIIASAARLLRERGIAGARIADVMKGAGLTVGGFYAHFDTKEALIKEMLTRTSTDLRERIFAEVAKAPPERRVELVLTRYLSTQHRDDPEHGCPFPAVVGEVGTSAPEYAEVLDTQISALAANMERILADGPPLSRRHRALALVAMMYGGLSLARALGPTPRSTEVLEACRKVAMGI